METGTVLYSCTIIYNFFYLLDMSVFYGRYGFSVPCIKADAYHFIEIVLTSKLFFKVC